MSSSQLTFTSTQTFRNKLMAKNLAPYNVPGVWSPVTGQLNYQTILRDYSVKDSPEDPKDAITSGYYANKAYSLNEFGPNEGFSTSINYNGPLTVSTPNQGEYIDIKETRLDIVNDLNIDAAYSQNIYGPENGFDGLVTITNVQLEGILHQPYWEPPSFEPSSYAPYEIFSSDSPQGDSGPLSDDSFIAQLGASRLKFAFQERVAFDDLKNSENSTQLNLASNPYEASLVATGQQPLVSKNYKITVPENQLSQNDSLAARLEGVYFPTSPIPGDYFQENTFGGVQTNQTSTALSVFNQATGGLLGPILNTRRNPSQIFLANTGSGQRFTLFNNISLNRYQAGYDKSLGGLNRLVEGVAQNALELLGLSEDRGGYYVGSVNTEPSQITSPANQVPIDPFGRQIQAIVYGPSELGKLYEGNEEKILFGLPAPATVDGGGIAGSFVWTSNKTKNAAGKTATPGGGVGKVDEQFNLISSNYTKNESTTFSFKRTSILDITQRLVSSADNVSGKSKLKHVGNAINQVSKVFNDGYKEITKGSKVIYYYDSQTKDNTITTGDEVGVEYCRLFTKDTPYYTNADLQKSAGITKEGRRFSYSVLDSTYNLNIAPIRGENSTNIALNEKRQQYAKKYMFSIENLAWRTSSKEGFRYDDLPACEKGPNGGRVMWFPPYDLKFNDNSSASWQETDFLGRPEPIYTYKNSKRTGQLSFSIVVDNPAVMNLIVDKQLKGKDNKKIDSILNSFFAGCIKYDLYALAKKFNFLKSRDLLEYQTILSKQNLTPQDIEGIVKAIPASPAVPYTSGVANPENPTPKVEPQKQQQELKEQFTEYGFYFEDSVPSQPDENFANLISSYASDDNITKYQGKADGLFDNGAFQSQTTQFFNDYVKNNWQKVSEGENSFVVRAKKILDEGGEIIMDLEGSASALGKPASNLSLSTRRVNSVRNYFQGTDLGKYIDNGKLKIRNVTSEGEGAVVPKSETQTAEKITCTENVKDKNGSTLFGSQVYSLPAMACRRVKIKNLSIKEAPKTVVDPAKEGVTNPSEEKKEELVTTTSKGVNDQKPYIPPRPKTNISVTQKLKDGIGKKILRSLLTECDYFSVMEQETPFIYDSIREKVKYFQPAFHSMTPEGLNARLTFLNQCMRPGETIPVIGPDGKPKFNDATNTSFGTPPILILRIGDFYHTKVVCDSLQISYEPLIYDMNPEGIGLQPMIAKVTMSIKFIGGHGLARPVEQLQNALSFNYYANTEIYDERAVFTESTEALDKKIFDAILEGEVSLSKKDTKPQPENKGGKPIGDILTTVPLGDGTGETGQTTFSTIMAQSVESTKAYFEGLVNFADSITKQYNYGIWKLVSQDSNYTVGSIYTYDGTFSPPPFGVSILGKPEKVDTKLENLFLKTLQDVDVGFENYILKGMAGFQMFLPSDIERLRTQLNAYITGLSSEFAPPIFNEIQNFVTYELDMVQILRKINVINFKTDGKIRENGTPFVYSLVGTSEIRQSNPPNPNITNTLEEISADYGQLAVRINDFYDFLKNQQEILPSGDDVYIGQGDDTGMYGTLSSGLKTIYDIRLYLVMAKIFEDKNKLEEFKNFLLDGGLKEVPKFEKKLNVICDSFRDIVLAEKKAESELFSKLKKNNTYQKVFLKMDGMFPNTGTRKCDYTTVRDEANYATQEQLVKDIWSTVNVNSDNKLWDGKVEFQ